MEDLYTKLKFLHLGCNFLDYPVAFTETWLKTVVLNVVVVFGSV